MQDPPQLRQKKPALRKSPQRINYSILSPKNFLRNAQLASDDGARAQSAQEEKENNHKSAINY